MLDALAQKHARRGSPRVKKSCRRERPTPEPNRCTSGVLTPNSTAAVNARRTPRTAGPGGGI